MKKCLPFWLCALALPACGSNVVVGPVVDASLAGDAVNSDVDAPAADASTPARDAPLGGDVVIARDAATNQLPDLCRAACAREAQQCAGGSQGCVDGCTRIQSMSGAERCTDVILAAVQCLVANGFTCMGTRGSPAPACRDVFRAAESCVRSSPGGDAGTEPPVEPRLPDGGGAPDV
jgi:hypothetical protein